MVSKSVKPAEVCEGYECLFHQDSKGRPMKYGVRQRMQNQMGETYWYHHEWGIQSIEDAQELCNRINGIISKCNYCDYIYESGKVEFHVCA